MVTPETQSGTPEGAPSGDVSTDSPTDAAAALVARLMNLDDHAQRVKGYTAYKVEASLRNGPLFEAWYAALPSDLTGLDLAPLYTIAADGDQTRKLRDLEKRWEPKAPFGETCNAPISDDGVPLRYNVRRWEEAKAAAIEAHTNRFKADWELLQGTDTPYALRQAAEQLMELALHPEGKEGDSCSPWDNCSSPPDVLGTAAAIRICLNALREIEQEAAEIAFDTAERLQRNLKDVKQVTRKYE